MIFFEGVCEPPFIMTGCGGWKEKEAKQAELQGIGLIVCALIIYNASGTHEEAVAKLMTFFEALAMVEGKDDVSLQSSGFRTIGCHQDFLSINPSLHKLQQYGNQFDIEVSCVKHPGSWATCTRVTLRKAYDTFVDLCDIGNLKLLAKYCYACVPIIHNLSCIYRSIMCRSMGLIVHPAIHKYYVLGIPIYSCMYVLTIFTHTCRWTL